MSACADGYTLPATNANAGYQWDYVFDWTILKHQQSATTGRPAAPRLEAQQGGGPSDRADEEEDAPQLM